MNRTVEVGKRIRQARKRSGMSQGDLGSYLGYSPSTIGRWELGYHEPTYSALLEIASILDVTPRWIFEGK